MQINYDAGIINIGNTSRLKKVFERAKNGEKLTIAFLGGSITQGSITTSPELCYAARTFKWWQDTFPNAEFTYINAGIGATDSQFGCARAAEDVLSYNPDLISVEYAVNDEANEHYLETFEGVVRKLLSAENAPAVYTFYNVFYNDGHNAQEMHNKVAKYYGLPAFGIKETIYPILASGELANREITPDDLHPNDKGHGMVADVITHCLKMIMDDRPLTDVTAADADLSDFAKGISDKIPTPMTANAYEDSVRFRNNNAEIINCTGFAKDETKQEYIRDIFKNGWTATEKGAKISFKVSGSCIGVQFRRTILHPAPIAVAKVDGEVKAVLDGNFDETWGDKLVLETLLDHGAAGEHIVEIELTETHEGDKLPFYLVSVIASGNVKPLFLNPTFSHTIWGGTRLRENYGYNEPGDDIGECWGISAHPNGEGTIRGGMYDGEKLSSLWKNHPELFGRKSGEKSGDKFPLLTKIIDARNDLSIQVHPDDEYAAVNENGSFGKTECWYVLDCPENASLVVGHNAKTKAELEDMINQGRWNEFIREIPVKKGDFIQIDPGTVHAIKGGLLILETQQNSDITYRVYDYDRLQNGKPRQLHVAQSIDVITVPAKAVDDSVKNMAQTPVNELCEMYSCKYYIVWKIAVEGEMVFTQDVPFLAMSILDGSGFVNGEAVKKGDHLILPAAVKNVRLSGNMELITSTSK